MQAVTAAPGKDFYLPVNLDFSALLPPSRHKHIPKYQYVIHKIHEERVFNKSYDPDEGVNLNAQILQKILTTKESGPIIKDLKAWGMLEVSKGYRPGKESKTYKLGAAYHDQPIKVVTTNDRHINKKLSEYKHQDYDRHNYTLTCLEASLNRLFIDFPAAFEHIYAKVSDRPRPVFTSFSTFFRAPYVFSKDYSVNNDKRKGVLLYVITFLDPFDIEGSTHTTQSEPAADHIRHLHKPFRVNKVRTAAPGNPGSRPRRNLSFAKFLKEGKSLRNFDFKRENRAYCNKHFNSDFIGIDLLSRRKMFFLRDTVGHRLHTNITTLRGELRQYLCLESGEQLVNLDIRNSQPTFFNILLNEYYKGKKLPADVQLYIDLTCKGKFYEHVMKALQIPETKSARTRFKTTFFKTVFFCKPKGALRNEETQSFIKLFPNVYEVIAYHKKHDHAQLAIQMQQKESNLIIDKVCGNLFKMYGKDFFCATIHDSILTTEKNADIVRVEMLKVFQSCYGLTPTINPENFNKIS